MLTSSASNSKSSSIIYGYKNYTELELGDVNILISVPHDGYLRPTDIPNRENDRNGNLKSDKSTRKFANFLQEELKNLFLKYRGIKANPFVIINNLHRIKMDPNRDLINCCFSKNHEAFTAYTDYHSMIDIYYKKNFIHKNNFEQGLILDIHGNSHSEQWVELGYLIKSVEFDTEKLSDNTKSSINSLKSKSLFSLDELIRGENVSLGSMIQNRAGCKVVPSPKYKSPSNGSYYSGGFITEQHGSFYEKSNRLNCIQIELPAWMRTDKYIEFSSKQIAKAVFDFYQTHSLESFNI
ncbi:unnamed protein product [Brachionus calyciflorus]|uniref:N-formylglutamate amidohydrolase n=1 Tax=Brachionus calyciflorus TaxID=104777 RepID=A0A813S976_9BILA|nr:unnamed protein product [Brachionus calyciflorus]